jgi:hypothetical protein
MYHVTFYTTPIYLSHNIPLPSVCHILYNSHLCVTCYTTPICLSHAIPLPSVCHMLYHSLMSVTWYITPICLSHTIPLPSVCHMLCHSHLSVICYTTLICLSSYLCLFLADLHFQPLLKNRTMLFKRFVTFIIPEYTKFTLKISIRV